MSSIDENIELARQLVEILLENEKNKSEGNKINQIQLSQKHITMLSVSKFIAIKENILKKDDRTIFFDNVKDSAFIDKIIALYDKLNLPSTEINGKRFYCNSTFVEIKDPTIAPAKLKNALLLYHKIRDAICHGKYEIKHKSIVINNDASTLTPPNDYCLKCNIPIEYLNEISLLYDSKVFQPDLVEKITDAFINLQDTLSGKISFVKNKFNNSNSGIQRKFKQMKESFNSMELINIFSNFANNNRQRRIINKKAKEFKELFEKFINNKPNKKINDRLNNIFLDICVALGIDQRMPKKDVVVALYNYMLLVFSQEKIVDYSIIPLDNIEISINPNNVSKELIDFFEKLPEATKIQYDIPNKIAAMEKAYNFGNGLSTIASNLIGTCNFFIENRVNPLKEGMEGIPNYSSPDYSKSILNYSADSYIYGMLKSFTNLYENIINELDSYRRIYYKELISPSMRNSVEHSNIFPIGYQEVALYDLSMHNYKESTNFSCIGKAEDLFELTKRVHAAPNTSKDDKCAVNSKFSDLKDIIGENEFKKLITAINDYSKEFFKITVLQDGSDVDKIYELSKNAIDELKSSHVNGF